MAKLIGFKGFLYNKDKIVNMGDVISLPYDKISDSLKKKYYSKSDYNIARVILGDQQVGDDSSDNKYTRAAGYLNEWIKDKFLIQDEEEALYIYDEQFESPHGGKLSRTGLIGMLELEEFSKGIVLPHEKTLSKPKADRLALIEECNMHFGQIFGIYEDGSKGVELVLAEEMEKTPYLDITTEEENIRHRLWKITDKSLIEKIQNEFADKKIYIADGHHRYSTGINYRDMMREKHPAMAETGLFNYIMMTLVNCSNEGLVVLPTHRVISNFNDIDYIDFKQCLDSYFEVKEVDKEDVVNFKIELEEEGKQIKFGVAIKGAGEFLILTLKDNDEVKEKMHCFPESLQKLDVTLLHTLIIKDILGITDKQLEEESYITYVRGVEDALSTINDGDAQAVLFLNPTKVGQILDVANDGQTMPQKSTDFYPKLYTGIVVSDFLV